MRYLTQVEHPADRSKVRWVFDVLLTLVAYATAVPAMYHDGSHPSVGGFVLLLIVCTPLTVRRIYPIPVFVWLLASNLAAALWSDRIVAGFALLVALYTVTAMTTRRSGLIAAAVLEVAAVIEAGFVEDSALWSALILASGLVGAALGLGLYAGARRDLLAELRDRALRLEFERDQQGALAAAAERGRISREMHDIVAHHLSVMIALSDGAVAATAASPERGIEVMRTVSATGRRALADTRRLLGVLRENEGANGAEPLAPQPDLADLDALIAQVRAAGLATSFEVNGSVPELAAGLQLTIYRLVQEALTNTLKHGGPGAHASVRLHYSAHELQVIVDDDGAGAAAPVAAGVGSGLRGMQERVNAYGGEVSCGPRTPAGWRVAARLRLDENAGQRAVL